MVHGIEANRPERFYQNLHALEYPIGTSDPSIVTFNTPGLPSRLASAWEVVNALKMPQDGAARPSVFDIVYPTIDQTIAMNERLAARPMPLFDLSKILDQMKALTSQMLAATPAPPSQALATAQPPAPAKSCVACDAQTVFTLVNGLQEFQTQHFCPLRNETQDEWLNRTKQQTSKAIEDVYKAYTRFTYNNEHEQLCRSKHVPPMALAHIAPSTFTLFSSQSAVMLFMYTAAVNALFAVAIFLCRWHGDKMVSSEKVADKIELHGYFTILSFLAVFMSLIPLFVDYWILETNGEKNQHRAVGSYVLGMWTFALALVYIKFLPCMHVAPEPASEISLSSTEVDEESNSPQNTAVKCKQVVVRFLSRQPLISLAYWNLLQSPCLIMIILTRHPYGVDVYTQFILFGAISIGALDVVHARVLVMMSVMRDVVMQNVATEKKQAKKLDRFVFVVFLIVKLCVAVPVLVKFRQVDECTMCLGVACLLFFTQTLQNLGVLMASNPNNNKLDDNSNYISYFDSVFVYSLIWHMLSSGTTFAILYFT